MLDIGTAKIDVTDLTAGTYDRWTIRYEVGRYAVDDGGEIVIARRDVCDSEIPQFQFPDRSGFVRVSTTADVELDVSFQRNKYIRPWRDCICIQVHDGALNTGDIVLIEYGAGGGPSFRVQSSVEREHIFRVLVDCAGSGNFYDIGEQPIVRISGGALATLQCVVPSFVEPNEDFTALIRGLDPWGNIAESHSGPVEITIERQTRKIQLIKGKCVLPNAGVETEETHRFRVKDLTTGITGESNPLICTREAGPRLYWADMHGQTKETVGIGSVEEYFAFARDNAFLDISAWQGNDFQITDDTWKSVCESVKSFNKDGRFVVFLGYEWSGTTPNGGDHNIYFLNDDEQIHRSYRWQIDMEKEDGSSRNPITKLFAEYKGRTDVLAIPHVGGRYGNLDMADPDLCRLIEIHSHHGTFEWFFIDALERGLTPGIVAASDDHTGRPGLSYPTESIFDVIGGYTAVRANSLDRNHVWEALRSRKTYGTTGARLVADVRCGDHSIGEAFETTEAPEFTIDVYGTGIIDEIELYRGREVVYRYSEFLPELQNRLRVQWSGVRTRSRRKRTDWEGGLTVSDGSFQNVEAFAFDSPNEGIQVLSNQTIVWKSHTSGDIDGVEFDVVETPETAFRFFSRPVDFEFTLEEVRRSHPIVMSAGGINQEVRVSTARKPGPRDVHVSVGDPDIRKGVNPYWVRVIQRDGHMAWTSPLYISL